MRKACSNSLLSLLLLTTLAWGGCLSCEQYFMFGGQKSCCAPAGHCKTKTPASPNSERECKQIAFDHQQHVDPCAELPALPVFKFELPIPSAGLSDVRPSATPIASSPPDLQVLNSTFLL